MTTEERAPAEKTLKVSGIEKILGGLSGDSVGKIPSKKSWSALILLGAIGGISYSYFVPPKLSEVDGRIFPREIGKPSVMRIYRTGQDVLLVQDQNDEGHYQGLEDYLSKIPKKARNAEREDIKKAAEWYK